jgi:excinuclease UvrABC nuclease subunit
MLVDRYGSIWNLRNADTTELAQTIKAPRSLAERIQSAATA